MMSVQTPAWESRLLAWAHQALDGHVPAEPVAADARTMERAYRYCAELTQMHSKTFYLASGLLPADKRRAARALYAFCRVSDDLVDRLADARRASFESWRQRIMAPRPNDDDPVALAWADTRARFRIPWRYSEQLLDGIARDLTATRYATFEELAAYAYGVASTVGLMAMHIIGYSGAQAIPYAIKLGVALQLTNILRDVGEDWRNGRLYLPLQELEAYGLSEADLAHSRVDDRWRAFMRFQIERTRSLYAEAWPGIAMLNPDGRFAIAAAADLYQAILEDIEIHHGAVFDRRASLSAWGKARRLPGIWWKSVTVARKGLT